MTPGRLRPDDMLPLTHLAFHVLLALSDAPLHGYALVKAVRERSDGRIDPGTGSFYSVIRGLADQSLIEPTAAPGGAAPDRRRYYAITPFGRRVLTAESARLEGLIREVGRRGRRVPVARRQPMTWFLRAYQRLLRRAPAAYRARFGDEIVATAAARVRDEHGVARMARMVRELADLRRTIRHERARDAVRPARGGGRADLSIAVRGLRRRPAEALAMGLVLALGFGAATLGFCVLSAVLLRPLPFGDPDRLVLLWGFVPTIPFGSPEQPVHGLRMLELRRSMATAASVEGFKADVFNLDAPGAESERINGLLTTAGLFDTMRVRPAAGRFFQAGDDQTGAPCAAVLGYGLWQRRFAGGASIVGAAVRLNGRACTVVGIAPRGFEFPRGGEMPPSFEYPDRTELWVAAPPPRGGPSDLTVLARLKAGVPEAVAQAEVDAEAHERDVRVPSSKGWNQLRVVSLGAQMVPAGITTMVFALFAAVVVLLLIASGNAAQLAVVRAVSRRRDLVVRAALGASPARLMRLVAAEIGVVTVAAAAIGWLIAAVGVQLVRAFGPSRFPRLADTTIDAGALVFLVGAAAVAGAVTALGPLWLARRVGRDGVLHDRERDASDALRHWRAALIACQVAMAVLLMAGSGLLVRSFMERLGVAVGFQPHGALAFELTLPANSYPEALRGAMPASRPATIAAIDAVLARVRAIPGVTAAGIGKPLPMSGAEEATVFAYEGMAAPRSAADVPIAEYIEVSDDTFRALGTPMIAGREFSGGDREHSEPSVVINETMARRLWPGQHALGRHVKLGGSLASPAPWLTIIGIVSDMKRYGLDDPPGPAMYVSYTQGPYASLATIPFIVRSSTRAVADLVPDIRAAVRAADLHVPVAAATPMDTMVASVSADAHFAMRLMLAVAGTALVLTMAGLYGTVAFAVSRRRRELGIRLALGAPPGQLVRLVVTDGVRPAMIGAVVGLPAAVGAGLLMRRLLFGVSPSDPWTFALAPALVAAVAFVACLVPARRAVLVDPRETLRGD